MVVVLAADRCACNLFPVPPQSIVDIAVTFPPPSNMPPWCQQPQQSRQCDDQAVTARLSPLLHGAERARDARCPAKGFGCTLGSQIFKAGRLNATCFQGFTSFLTPRSFMFPSCFLKNSVCKSLQVPKAASGQGWGPAGQPHPELLWPHLGKLVSQQDGLLEMGLGALRGSEALLGPHIPRE